MPKNTLTIRLTEAAVFIRTSENNARRRNPNEPGSRPAMVRGLLTLTIVKPIKITCIDLELQARSLTSWPEGIGARGVDMREEHKVFSESTVFFRAGPAPRRTASVGPGVHPWHDEDYPNEHPPSTPSTPYHNEFETGTSRPTRAARRVSADSSYFLNHDYEQSPPVPPYSPLPATPSSSTHASPGQSSGHLARGDDHPAHALEDFRNALRASLTPSHTATGDRSPVPLRSSGSSLREIDRSLSRRPSVDTLAEMDEDRRDEVSESSSPIRETRGRHARFSLSSVSSVLKEVVRSSSPRMHSSKERDDSVRRGRTREKTVAHENSGRSKERHTHVLSKFVGHKDEKDKGKSKSDNWKEFKKGTYTFPISFSIPANAPPTMECPWGTLIWRLKANVHRPGALTSRLSAVRQVVVIAAPTEDDTEDTENVIVERHWEQHLQYLISISGRSFPIGGIIPISMTLMPLAKMKIHRLSIYVEEKTEYFSQMKRVVRTDPVLRIPLLSAKNDDKIGGPILPLDSNDVDALSRSPLLAFTSPGDDLSELASSWMGPGPWTFHQALQLPSSCSALHFTNKNKRSNMCVTHLLKCVIRVERGDDVAVDPKTGKRKLFDIVVQTPVHILSCRCNPEWMSLPQYSASFEDPIVGQGCPCDVMRRGALERTMTHHSTDSTASAAETSPVHAAMPSLSSAADTLFARNTLFERLMSGQESESGEVPPAYATV